MAPHAEKGTTMIEILLRNARLIHQTADDKFAPPETTLALCSDANGLLVLSQEGRDVVINLATVPDLRKALNDLSFRVKMDQAAERMKEQEAQKP